MSVSSQKVEPATPSDVSPVCSERGANSPQGLSVPLQTKMDQPPVTRNLHQDFVNQGHMPVTVGAGITSGLPPVSMFTESTKIHTDKQQENPAQQQFRVSAASTSVAVQAHTLGFLGNSGYFAPINAPL